MSMPSITVLGAGAFGTCLAHVLANKQIPVLLWGRSAETMEQIQTTRQHPYRMSHIELEAGIVATSDLSLALRSPQIIYAIPAQSTRDFWQVHKAGVRDDVKILLASKGLEQGTGQRLDQIFADVFGQAWVDQNLAAIGGPTFAKELIEKMPSAAVVAAKSDELAMGFQHLLATDYFRLYRSTDIAGVEIAGAIKNVIAIATGITDGLGFGLNTRAALITRGLAEMIRYGTRLGADLETFSGLAGIGDLVLTATGDISRNRTVGLRIGRGESLEDILADMKEVAEGVATTKSIRAHAKTLEIELPIVEKVGQILFENKDPKSAVYELMTRSLKSEEF